MKKLTLRVLSSVLASILMFSSISASALASDNVSLQTSDSKISMNQSGNDDGYADLKKQMEKLLEEGSSDSSDPAEDDIPLEDTEDWSGQDDTSDSASDLAATGETSSDDEDILIIDDSSDSSSDDTSSENSLSAASEAESMDEKDASASVSSSDVDADDYDIEAEDKEILQTGNWSYYLDRDNYAHIVGYIDTEATTISIPKKIGKYYVVAIDEGAFSELSKLISITIPFYVKNIDSNVFSSAVTINAYHGTTAAIYAAVNGYSFENRSELDFADAVIDLTEIYRANYSRIAELEFEFDKLEASYLEEGTIFYLAPSDEVPNGDIYKVIAKEDNGDSFIIRVERSVGKEALNTLHIDEENLKPDWYTATYFFDEDEDGTFEEYSLSDMKRVGNEYQLNGVGRLNLDLNKSYGMTFNVNHEIDIKNSKDKYEDEYPNGLPDWLEKLPSYKVKVKVAGELGLEEKYSLKADIDFLKGKITKLETIKSTETSYDITLSGSASAQIPLAVYSVPSPGLSTIKAEADLVIDCSGKISLKFSTTSETGVRYVDGQFQDIRSCDSDTDFSISGQYSIYLHAEVKTEIKDVISLTFEANVGLQYSISDSISDDIGDKKPLSSLNSKVTLFSELKITFTFKLWGTLDTEIEKNFDRREIVLYESLISAYTVMFVTGKSYAIIPTQTVPEGGYATEPDTNIVYHNASGDSIGIEGWYKDASYTEKWDFENTPIKDNTIIYGKVIGTSKATIDYSSIGEPNYSFEVPHGKHLVVNDTKKKMNYRFEAFYKDKEYTTKWDLENDLVPDHDFTIYAKYNYEEGYNPWNEDISEGESITDDGITYSTEGFKYRIDDSTAIITGYEGNDESIAVPSIVQGSIKVTSIESNVFRENKNIKNLLIPGGISIPEAALNGCINLERISIPTLQVSTLICLFSSSIINAENEIARYPKLKKVELTGSDNYIPAYAFRYWKQIEEISYPDCVTEIGYGAFYGCKGLKKLPIGENVSSIGDSAFYECTNVTRIDIPNSVKNIGKSCFADCTNVTKVTIPNNGITLEYSAFSGLVNLKEIVIPSKARYYDSVLIGCRNLERISIPTLQVYSRGSTYDGLIYLFSASDNNAEVAARYPKLKKVEITGRDNYIPAHAFQCWKQIEEISYPDCVTEIRDGAFYGCKGLKKLPIGKNVSSIGGSAFYECTNVTRIDISNSVKSIGSYCFASCTNVTKVTMPNNEITLENNAFSNLVNLKEIVIPSKARYYDSVLNGCINLERISIPTLQVYSRGHTYGRLIYLFSSSIRNAENAENVRAKYPKLKKVEITGSDNYIPAYAFQCWKQIEEVSYPDCVTEIRDGAFSGCKGLKKLPIGENVSSIGGSAFNECTNVTRIDIPNSVKNIGKSCFADCTNVTKVTIPNNGITLEYNAFSNLVNLKEIVIPSKARYYDSVLNGCINLERISIPTLHVYSGGSTCGELIYLFSSSSRNAENEIARYPKLKKVEITGSDNYIPGYAFRYWKQIEEISYPDCVTEIRNRAFYGCKGLKKLPIGENVSSIGDSAFGECTNVTRIDIPNSVKNIGDSCFADCTNVTKVTIPNNGITLEYNAFSNLVNLKEIVIPSKARYYNSVLKGCINLERISIPTLLVYYGDSTYGGLINLFSSPSSNAENEIARYPKLKKVELTGSDNYIPAYAFQYWKQIEEIRYPDCVTEIRDDAFYGCAGLKRICFPSGVKSIGSNAFNGCTNFNEIIVYADKLDVSKIPIKKDTSGNIVTTIYGHVDSKAYEYAQQNNIPFEEIDENYAPVTYVFNNGQDDVVSYEKIGELINKPIDPSYNGFTFDKWYFDEGLTVPWDFDYDIMPACGITLYADWNANESIINNFTYEDDGTQVTITGYVGTDGYVVIPEKVNGLPVTKLGDKAFAYDNDVVGITIPKSVVEIADNCFMESPFISSITVSTGNEAFSSEDGILFDKEKTELVLYPAKKQGNSYTLPDTVCKIRDYAFGSAEVDEVICNEGLEEIGEMAFSNCSVLTRVVLPSTVNTFGKFVFWNSPKVKVFGPVGNVDIDNFTKEEMVDYNIYVLNFISDGQILAQYEVQAGELVSDNLKETLKGLTKDSYQLVSWLIQGDENGKAWDFNNDEMPQNDLTLVADWNCVYKYSLTDNKATITGIGVVSANYELPETIDGFAIVGIAKGAFTNEIVESVTIPAGITEFEDGAFHDDVTIIADADSAAASFARDNNLGFKERKYPVVFESNGGSACQTGYVAKGGKITSIPKPVKDNNHFRAWYTDEYLSTKWNFDTDVMPGEGITLYAGWNKIDENIEDDVFAYETVDGLLTITGYSGSASYVEIPSAINGVTVNAIGEYAFAFKDNVYHVVIPDTVTDIGSRAFYNCVNLDQVDFGANVESIGSSAFAGCTSLNKVDLSGTKISEIPDSCFMQAVNLYFVTLPETVAELGDSSFAGCTYLQAIELPATVRTIGKHAFYNDKVLKELTIPAVLTRLGEGFIDGCTSIKAINTDGKGAYAGIDGILYNYDKLIRCPEGYSGSVFIPDNVSIIQSKAFYNCSRISAVTLGKSVYSIGTAAFSGCRSMQYFFFAEKNEVLGISDSMFYGCSNLSSITLPKDITAIGRMAFSNCVSLTTLTIGEDVTSIGNNAFFGDDKLTVFGYADTEIERYADKNPDLKFEYIADKAVTPEAPEAESVINTTITIKGTEGYEYRMNDGKWQSSNVFTGLEPNTAYTFYQRVAESPYVHASNSSAGTVIVSGKNKGRAVKAPVVRKVTSSSVTVAKVTGCEYSIDGINYQSDPVIHNLKADTEYVVYQRAAETEDTDYGDAVSAGFKTTIHSGPCIVIFDVNGGAFTDESSDTITITCKEGERIADPGVPVRKGYTFEGWYQNNEPFDFDIAVDNDIVLKAKWILHQQVKTPTANIDGSCPVDKNTKLILRTETIDADIYYTVDGSVPDEDSNLYEKPITITSDITIRAIAVKDGSAESEILTLKIVVTPLDDELGDLTEEDIPASEDDSLTLEERIPKGLWVAGLESDIPYTGKAITQKLRVYDHKTLLTLGKDYTIAYKNNINAGKATVTVTGAGSYAGSVKLEYSIVPLDIGLEEYRADDIYVAYNKKAQKPSVVLYKGSTKLALNKDYTVSWTNENGKAGAGFTLPGDYEITVTGKGNYTGSRTLVYHVTQDTLISKVKLKAISAQKYTGEQIRPAIILTDKKYTLIENTDYTVTWPEDCISVGKVTAYVSGIGKYAGTREVSFSITGKALNKTKMTGFVSSFNYDDGKDITQDEVVILDGKKKLTEGMDYTVSYENNTDVGTATVLYTGIGGYTGTIKKTFKIKGVSFKSAAITGIAASYIYDDSDVVPAGAADDDADVGTVGVSYTYTVTDAKTKVKTKEKVNLVKDVDYTVSYKNNHNVGTATVIFTGKGKYTGSISKTFKITAYNINKDTESYLEVGYENSVSYVKNGSKPPVKVIFRGRELKSGADYTVTYANNNAVTTQTTKKLPSISIKGKGNFTGVYKSLNFNITAQDISLMKISVPDKVFVKKAKAYVSIPVLTDISNGVKLVSGKDYNKTIVYKYAEDVVVTQVIAKKTVECNRKKNDLIEAADIVPVGTIIMVEVSGINNYTGTITGYYKVMETDISKATVKINDQTYTGDEIVIGKDQIASIKIGKTNLRREDYDIVDYANNINVGNAKITIRGKGKYGGFKTVTFKIVKKKF